jgi:hypothetical protein
MKHCDTEWALLADMDRLLPPDAAVAAVEMSKSRGEYYRPNQVWKDGPSLDRPHPNSFIIRVADYWKAGGYDEDFAGFYGTDGNFRKNLKPFVKDIYVTQPYFLCYEKAVKDSITNTLPRKEQGSYCLSIPHLRAKVAGPPYVAQNPLRFPWEQIV